jgi:DeoR/GlpR family transcriptional regulator of sugar metabolism
MASKKEIRQGKIVELLKVTPTTRVNEMAGHLEVTAETIRRDLDEMHDKGLLERTYGGAILQMSHEPSLDVRHSLLVREREVIARDVIQEIKGAKHLMIGSGATTVHIARRIAADLCDITVIVHSFGVAMALSHNPTIKVIMAPGLYDATEGANHGVETIKFLESYWVDYAIVSASGITKDGPCDALLDAGSVYSQMISRAFQTILAADKSKFNLKFPARFADWRDISMLVTNQIPPDEILSSLHQNNVVLRTAITREL